MEEKIFKIELNTNEVQQVINAFAEFPYKSVFQIIHKIQGQLDKQLSESKNFEMKEGGKK